MQRKLRNLNKPQWLFITLTAFLIACFILNLKIQLTGFGDDDFLFYDPLMNKFNGDILAFLVNRYQTWSSRTVIEIFTLLSVRYHLFWRICNSLIMFLAISLPPFLLKKNNEVRTSDILISGGLFFTMPLTFFNETGWIATTTNYLWVYSLGLLSLYPIAKYLHDEKVNQPTYLISWLAALYACNQEQMCALLLGFYLVFLGYLLIKKRRIKILLPFFVINFLSLFYVLSANGNDIRYEKEVANWFPDFENLTLFRKFELGFSSTVRHLFFDKQITILLFSLLLVIFVSYYLRLKKKPMIISLFGFIPLIVSIVFGFNDLWNFSFVTKILLMFNGYGTVFNIANPATWTADIVLAITFLAVLITVLYLQRFTIQGGFSIILLLAGLASRMLMAFSPTIWASATRTYIFTYGIFILITLSLFESLKLPKKTNDFLTGMIFLVGVICYGFLFLAI